MGLNSVIYCNGKETDRSVRVVVAIVRLFVRSFVRPRGVRYWFLFLSVNDPRYST